MSYRLESEEDLADGLRRLAREQLEAALTELNENGGAKSHRAIHEARKHLKKTRAILRLSRGAIGKRIYRHENSLLRAAGRALSEARDARVRRQTLDKLANSLGKKARAFSKIDRLMKRELATATSEARAHFAKVENTLREVGARVNGWPLREIGQEMLERSLTKSYRRGRKAWRKVRRKPSAENFHAWRKRVKDLLYQSRALQNLHELVLQELARNAKQLARQLGELHDLAFLQQWLATRREAGTAEGEVLLGLASMREKELETIALDLGSRFFAEKPRAFAKHFARETRTSLA